METFHFLASAIITFCASQAIASGKIASVEFAGNQVTHNWILEREMLIRSGDDFDAEKFERSLQNIRNLRIFRDVQGSTQSNTQGDVILKVTIQEKQTLLPFFRLKQGGGSTLVVLGLGDLNTLGRGFEFLPMYENLNGKYHGGRVDARLPRVNGWHTTVEASVAAESRSHTLFNDSNKVTLNFLDRRQSARIGIENDITQNARWFGSGMIQKVRTSGIDASALYSHMAVGLGFGRINYRDYRLEGTISTIKFENIARQEDGDSQNIQFEIKSFLKAAQNWDVAFRGSATFTSPNATVLQKCSIGGFSEVRGFLDERYRGAACWFANTEIRYIAYTHPWYVLQPSAFADAGVAAPNFSQANFEWQKNPASVGSGVRVIFPYLARLILRADIGFPVSPQNAPMGISLGSTQFF